MRYHNLARNFDIDFVWVKGHAENIFNNRCDILATTAADGDNLLDDIGYEPGIETTSDLF